MTPISMEEHADERKLEEPDTKGDRLNIFLLSYMNVLQSIPRSLASTIPLILQNRKVTYADQAGYSFVAYSFCFKILWAPIVDCIYLKKVGRRKTWIIPTQFMIGILFFVMATNIDEWLGSEDGTQRPKVGMLTIVFFLCVFFASTQDIAVDGWSLTMLQKRNRGHASTCATIGFVGGQLSSVAFIILDSKDFCNKFRSVPQDHGFVAFSDFLMFWSAVFIISTTLLLIFKKEKNSDLSKDCSRSKLNLVECYNRLWQILKIGPVQRVAFAAINGVSRLKLMDAGVPRDAFVLLTTPSLFILLPLPFVLSRYTAGRRAMRVYSLIYALNLTFCIVYTIFIFYTPYAKDEHNAFPTWYYWLLSFICNVEIRLIAKISQQDIHTNSPMVAMEELREGKGFWTHSPPTNERHNTLESYTYIPIVVLLVRHVGSIASLAFHSRISDPRYGGIYLTLLSTASNVGHRWPLSLSLWFVDTLTLRSCVSDGVKKANVCSAMFDGFYTESIICALIGILWLVWARKQIYELEDMDASAWLIKENLNIKEKQILTDNTRTLT